MLFLWIPKFHQTQANKTFQSPSLVSPLKQILAKFQSWHLWYQRRISSWSYNHISQPLPLPTLRQDLKQEILEPLHGISRGGKKKKKADFSPSQPISSRVQQHFNQSITFCLPVTLVKFNCWNTDTFWGSVDKIWRLKSVRIKILQY